MTDCDHEYFPVRRKTFGDKLLDPSTQREPSRDGPTYQCTKCGEYLMEDE